MVKKITWHTSYGEISVFERTFLDKGKLHRPFSYTAEVTTRCYSLPLQRIITDFGADVSFQKISKKLIEHYGISVSVSSAQKITEKHAESIKRIEYLHRDIPEDDGVKCLICETDGTMIPIVDTVEKNGTSVDKRKTRSVRWKEARLAFARQKDKVDRIFSGTLGLTDMAGDHLFDCAVRAGFGGKTKVHCVGDGAPWIAEQVERVFGNHGNYLIDFYHLCDYMAAASKKCFPENPDAWLDQQKKRMEEGAVNEVLKSLSLHEEPKSIQDKDAPVRCCLRCTTKFLYPNIFA
ncbi:MAG: hypothetical protein KKC46_03730 [Proteobacteria bacterium]|nr:hypothetical protein [Pseudomonadota bacterium]